MTVVKALNYYPYAKMYIHHIEFLELLSTTKLLKFKICKNEKAIISNLKNVKKEKRTPLIFMKNLLMKIIFTGINFLSCQKEVRRQSGRYKV